MEVEVWVGTVGSLGLASLLGSLGPLYGVHSKGKISTTQSQKLKKLCTKTMCSAVLKSHTLYAKIDVTSSAHSDHTGNPRGLHQKQAAHPCPPASPEAPDSS